MRWYEIAKNLSHKENWTEQLIYVHKTRLILGFILGIILGYCLGLLF